MEITFISDDRSLGELYRLKLELDGYWVTLAPSLAEGLDRLHDRVPDLAFIDFGRGVKKRLDALGTLRRDPALRNLPIVLLLRDGEGAVTVDELQLGATDFVVNVDRVASED